jgi:hypothetical protein
VTWKPQPDKWNWRAHLTKEEAAFIKSADDDRQNIERLKANWERRYARERQLIANRAIHRAKHAAMKRESIG